MVQKLQWCLLWCHGVAVRSATLRLGFGFGVGLEQGWGLAMGGERGVTPGLQRHLK